LAINAYALDCDVLEGLRKIHTHMAALPLEEKSDLGFKLRLREKMDAEASEKAPLDLSSLPILQN
jgi:hypothetical protein